MGGCGHAFTLQKRSVTLGDGGGAGLPHGPDNFKVHGIIRNADRVLHEDEFGEAKIGIIFSRNASFERAKAMSDSGPDKMNVDESWKAQVEREKANAGGPADTSRVTPPTGAEEAKSPAQPEETRRRGPLPAASFLLLVEEYVTHILLALGAMPHPVTGKTMKDPELAKHYVDMLGVLAEKTKGNLTTEEQRVLDSALYEMRMTYVKMKRS